MLRGARYLRNSGALIVMLANKDAHIEDTHKERSLVRKLAETVLFFFEKINNISSYVKQKLFLEFFVREEKKAKRLCANFRDQDRFASR